VSGYSKVFEQFWTGETGKLIRARGVEAQLVACYLMTNRHRNMIGIYYLPLAYLSADTGLPIEGASKALQALIEVGFCGWDQAAEVVWVFEMARYQIAESLKPTDKQCGGVSALYRDLPNNCFLSDFFEKYGVSFHLKEKRRPGASEPQIGSSNGPSMSLGCQKQLTGNSEQEQVEFAKANSRRPDVRLECFHDAWNENCRLLPKVQILSKERRKKLSTRISEGLTLERFVAAVKTCASTEFLSGGGSQGWTATFDWMIANDTHVAAVLEGKYGTNSALEDAESSDKPVLPDAGEFWGSETQLSAAV
jgi:hypothetical protein